MYLDSKKASELSSDEINKLVPPSRELVIFHLIDAVAQKNIKRAVSFAHDLVISGANESYIVTMLHRQIKQIYSWQLLDKLGLDAEKRTKELGLSEFTRRKLLAQIPKFPRGTLPGKLSALIIADEEIKSSKLPGTIILEKLIVRLAG